MSALAGVLALAVAGFVATPIGVRGRTLEVRLYGERGGTPVVLASGEDAGADLGTAAAVTLAANGYFVVVLDARQYLSLFTARGGLLSARDVSGDFATLVSFATGEGITRPVLVGIADGAGLATLAAADPVVKGALRGLVAIDLRDRNELAWHSPDWISGVVDNPDVEPGFSVAAIVDRLAPLPLAQLQAREGGLVPLPEAQRLYDRAREPKRLWVMGPGVGPLTVDAGEIAGGLLEAMNWIAQADSR
jgi:hypothetical protein